MTHTSCMAEMRSVLSTMVRKLEEKIPLGTHGLR
jgi:hypothetical protein